LRLVSMTGTRSWLEMFLILAAMRRLRIVERGRSLIHKSKYLFKMSFRRDSINLPKFHLFNDPQNQSFLGCLLCFCASKKTTGCVL
jgi:hypothetical protein